MKKRRFFWVLSLTLVLLLQACASQQREPREIRAQIEKKTALPSGVWYTSGRAIWEEEYLPSSLRRLFFGEEEIGELRYAVFLGQSPDAPAEIVLLSCNDARTAERISSHLAARLSLLQAEGESVFGASLADAAVVRRGLCVLYTATPCNKEILSCFG